MRNERIKFAALEHQRLALSTAVQKRNLHCIVQRCQSTVIFLFFWWC